MATNVSVLWRTLNNDTSAYGLLLNNDVLADQEPGKNLLDFSVFLVSI